MQWLARRLLSAAPDVVIAILLAGLALGAPLRFGGDFAGTVVLTELLAAQILLGLALPPLRAPPGESPGAHLVTLGLLATVIAGSVLGVSPSWPALALVVVANVPFLWSARGLRRRRLLVRYALRAGLLVLLLALAGPGLALSHSAAVAGAVYYVVWAVLEILGFMDPELSDLRAADEREFAPAP